MQFKGLPLIAFDTETFLIDVNAPLPRVVCVSIATKGADGVLMSRVIPNADWDALRTTLEALFQPGHCLVGQNVSYDLGVVVNSFPELHSAVWRKVCSGEVIDTRIIEKLITLSSSGDLEWETAPDGSSSKRKYSLERLAKVWLNANIGSTKQTGVRLRYSEMDGKPLTLWPGEFIEYAEDDARLTLLIAEEQLKAVASTSMEEGALSVETVEFHTAVSLPLQLASARGVLVDVERVELARLELLEFLDPKNFGPLYESGILRPAIPPRPHKKNPERMTKGSPETRNKKVLAEVIEEGWRILGEPVKKTPKEGVCADKEVQARLAPVSPLVSLYQRRESVSKLVSTELPRLSEKRIGYPGYDPLVSTGRTSSYAQDLVPSFGIQNMMPVIRPCLKPRDGYLFLCVDYSYLELCAAAYTLQQPPFNLRSVLADVINSGKDPHAYLGSGLAYELSSEFRAQVGESRNGEELYRLFVSLAKTNPEFYGRWRKFAKPTGFGYLGGLGAARFVRYAKSDYDIDVTEDQARHLKQIYFRTYPEFAAFFEMIPRMLRDRRNMNTEGPRYEYRSPLGMVRRGCHFTDCANGVVAQTPAAEGAKMALLTISRGCYDPGYNDALYGCGVWLFLHDEIGLEIPDDQWAHERVMEVQRIMKEQMERILQGMRVGTEPALMHRWYKQAKPVYDENDRIVVWTPDKDRIAV